MTGLDVEEEYFESDLSDNDEKHSKLLSSVSQLDSTQRVKPALRKEASSEVSEFNLTKGGSATKNLVHVKELAKVLGKKSSHASITKKFNKVTRKAKTLPKPLEKPVEERLKRSVGFENLKQQLRRWDAVITRNALNDHLQFPLSDNSMKMQKSTQFLKQFKTVTPLEMKIAEALKQDNKPDKEEEEDEFPLTFEEMMEKRREMAQLRAKLSYKEAKAQRQSKIKSKKYHRILKREKLRQQLKEFELLQKTDPDAALKKLSELDKNRAQERASLRHRNTGQWAKNLTVRAKYDVESRKVLADQLRMSREITQKVHRGESSDEEESTEPVTLANVLLDESSKTDVNNPWAVKVSDEVKNFVSGYKKYWSEKNKEAQENRKEEGVEIKIEKTSQLNATQNGVESKEESSASKETPKSNNNAVTKTKVITLNNNAPSSPSKRTPKKKETETPKSPPKNNTESSPSKRTPKKKKEVVSSVSIHPASGVWIVTPIVDENHSGNKRKRKADDIDDLFEDLNEKLMKKAVAKAKKLESKLKLNKKWKDKKKSKEEEKEFDLSMKNGNAVSRPDMDVELFEGSRGEEGLAGNFVPQPTVGSTAEAPPEIDPKNFIRVTPKRLNTCLPDNVNGGDDALDDEEVQQQMIIEEAFGDDDVIAEFTEMKEEEEKSNQVEITKSLPGWGEWGGTGIVPNPRKKKRLVLNSPPKKDAKKKDIIINENENPKLRDHMVKEVPHPFKSVEAFEAAIRTPVGRDFVPESAHRKLIRKQVDTKLGAIIEPMDEEEIVRLKKKAKSPYQGKKKNTE